MHTQILILDNNDRTLLPLVDRFKDADFGVETHILTEQTPIGIEADVIVVTLASPHALRWCEQTRETPTGAIIPIIFAGPGHERIQTPADALIYGGDTYLDQHADFSAWQSVLTGFIAPHKMIRAVREPHLQTQGGPHLQTTIEIIGKQQILAKHQEILRGNYYQILDVSEHASIEEINAQRDALLKKYSPIRCAPWILSEHSAHLADIARVIHDAHFVLTHTPLKDAYTAAFG